ncbi:fungal-specific transcription factor domain-containing protein [Mycena crocata]|nr:fungal-specific transcription factor domain-containing protein [Mycena crocata]
MSSNDEQDPAGLSKKRRIQRARACDICRRKKIRCDGAQLAPGSRCSNCIAYGFDCSYVEAAKKRGPPKGYVESMEIRVEKIERLLQTLIPEVDLAQELPGVSVGSWPIPPVVDEEDERAQLDLTESLQHLSLNSDRGSRFFGRSSGAMLLQTALNVKMDAEPQNARRHTEFWTSRPSPEPAPPPRYDFPPPDLATSLVDLYFTHINLLLPLLHRPTFTRDLIAGLHLTNSAFAATFLLVCAVGSRFSSDPRILLDGIESLHSCGWRWFKQVRLMRDTLLPATLYDLQCNALSVLFLHGTSAPQACWTLVSTGIRMAQDVGAHRRKEFTNRWTAEDELRKRAFWVLLFLDRMVSSHYGRPCAILDEDFDLDLPSDCDDDFWETPDPAQAFQQPKSKPSRISAFIAYLRLCQVLSFALRTIYPLNKSKNPLGLSKSNNIDLEDCIVVELDSALQKWIEEIPDHLRWNPTNEHAEFFEQSVALHCSYYHLQIIIHRPYIPSPKKMGRLAFPSLAICLNAARACSHIADTHRQRTGGKPLPLSQMAVFTAGTVLLLNIWGGKRNGLGLSTDSGQEMAEVHRCMQVLRGCEMRWQSAGRMWDVLYELANVGQLPLPPSGNMKNKRERGAEEPKPVTDECGQGSESSNSGSSGTSARNVSAQEPRIFAGHRRPPPTDVSNIMSSGSLGSNPIRNGRPMVAGRRLHTSDVPAITTQFLPHFQRPSQAYGPDTPLSTSSSHSQQPDRFAMSGHRERRSYPTSLPGHQSEEAFVPLRQDEDPSSFARSPAPGPPDTPLSASSLHQQELVYSMHRSEESHLERTHIQLDIHLSIRSHQQQQGIPFVPPMNPRMAPMHDFLPSRRILDDNHAGNGGRGQEYWYPDEAQTSHGPIPTHQSHLSPNSNADTNANRLPAGSTLASPSFPMSEAFYEQLTASFSSAPHTECGHRHADVTSLSYPAQTLDEYSEGEMRHQVAVPSNASHSDVSTQTQTHLCEVRGGGTAPPLMDPDALAMWSAAPMGFE